MVDPMSLPPQAPVSYLDVGRVRRDFPILGRKVHGDKPLIYLDNAATTQKPQPVIDAVRDYYTEENANIHRGVHYLSEQATEKYEAVREQIRACLGATSSKEILFVRGATEAINLVAQSFARPRLGPDSEVLITELEHHANIVPWQLVCEQTGAQLRYLPMNARGELVLDELDALLNDNTVIVAAGHVSNALGTINPVQALCARARACGAAILLDGAQALPHMAVDVQGLDCDFYVFSGHKVFAPTGIGVLYGRQALLEAMPPYQGGGDMIRTVQLAQSTWNELPWKFEAGTPHIAGVIGLGAALHYLSEVGLSAIQRQEQMLLEQATAALQEIPGLHIQGTAAAKTSIVSFVLDGIHPHDVGTIVDHEGIAIRVGHHCAMPVMARLGLAATARASFAFYNSLDEVTQLARAVTKCREVFAI